MRRTSKNERVTLYFGKPGKGLPRKTEVEQFIRTEMCLVQGTDKTPRWSEGILELIDYGMDAYLDEIEAPRQDTFERLKDEISELQEEKQRLQTKLEMPLERDTQREPEEQVQLMEARILEILSRRNADDGEVDHEQTPYQELREASYATGYDFYAVLQTCRLLALKEYGGYIDNNEIISNSNVSFESDFERYCEEHDIQPHIIKTLNGGL